MIQSDHTPYRSFALSHPGMSGKNNEDRYAVTPFLLSEQNATPALLAVLSDGIGGHRAGEVAAEVTVETITHLVAASDAANPPQVLQNAVTQASNKVQALANTDPKRQGMGATCAVVWLIGDKLYTITVGDSRIYLMKGNSIRQVSIDHTWIQEALDAGVLQADEIGGHPNAHVIRRYLGSPTPPEGDLRLNLSGDESDATSQANQGMMLQAGDRLLLCSDGLSDLVHENEMLASFQSLPMEAALQELVDLANQRGGHDNITAVAIEIPPSVVKSASLVNWQKLGLSCLAGLGLAAVGVIIAGVAWLLLNSDILLLPALRASPIATATIETYVVMPTLDKPTATLAPATAQPPTITPFIPMLVEGGATLTPWHTHTYAPTATPTPTP